MIGVTNFHSMFSRHLLVLFVVLGSSLSYCHAYSVSPTGGTYPNPIKVRINGIYHDYGYYTTNGADPTTSDGSWGIGLDYYTEININKTCVLKTIGYTASGQYLGSYTYEYIITSQPSPVATPTVEPEGGTYVTGQNVTIRCLTPGAVIHYTTNGVDPTESDLIINSGSSLRIDDSMTLKVRAFKTNWLPSDLKSVVFNITHQVPTPIFTPDACTYTGTIPLEVRIGCDYEGVVIHYTVDGRDPTELDSIIASGDTIAIDHNLTLKARAWKPGLSPSLIKSADYSITIVPVTTERISVAYDGGQANGDCSLDNISVSADGRYVVFSSDATNLVQNDTNAATDVFLRDRATGQTICVSRNSNGVQGLKSSSLGNMSADGRYICFVSALPNLVINDTNRTSDIFVRDCQTGITERISTGFDGRDSNNTSYRPTISADGRFVCFDSYATNIVSGYNNDQQQVIVKDRLTGQASYASVSSDGTLANKGAWVSCISGNGRYVAFRSASDNLIVNDTNNEDDIFVHDMIAGTTVSASVGSDGIQANNESLKCSISHDGRYVAFSSWATNLMPNDTNSRQDIFVHDIETNKTICVSQILYDQKGSIVNDFSISATGRFIALESFVYDMATGMIDAAGVSSTGVLASSRIPCITPDGRYFVFSSADNFVVPNDTGFRDVFIHDRGLQQGFVDRPRLSPEGGIYYSPQSIVVECDTQEAMIYYTTNGIEPTQNDPAVSPGSAVTVDRSMVLKVKAMRQGWISSETQSASYIITRVHSTSDFVKGNCWNLVSIPVDPDPSTTKNGDPSRIFSGIDVANASLQFWKNNESAGGWQVYGDLFGWTGPVRRGTAYWFMEANTVQNKEIAYYGNPSDSDFEITIPAHSTVPYWIMLGTPFPTPVSADAVQFKNVVRRGDVWLNWTEAFSQAYPSQRIVDSNAMGWSAPTRNFFLATPSTWPGTHQFDPWLGYWLLVCDRNELKIKFPKP